MLLLLLVHIHTVFVFPSRRHPHYISRMMFMILEPIYHWFFILCSIYFSLVSSLICCLCRYGAYVCLLLIFFRCLFSSDKDHFEWMLRSECVMCVCVLLFRSFLMSFAICAAHCLFLHSRRLTAAAANVQRAQLFFVQFVRFVWEINKWNEMKFFSEKKTSEFTSIFFACYCFFTRLSNCF